AGAGVLVTMLVSSDVAVVEPAPFVAFTATRSRCWMSPARTPYVLPVAPTTSTQLVPALSHRCHWYENESGAPVHVPGSAVSSSPTLARPETVGRDVFFGAELDETTAVCSDAAVAAPSALIAVTSVRIRCPTSLASSVYVLNVSPTIVTQPVPSESHRCQRMRKLVGLFCHVPRVVVSVSPSRAGPVITGFVTFTGAAAEAADAFSSDNETSPMSRAMDVPRRRIVDLLLFTFSPLFAGRSD